MSQLQAAVRQRLLPKLRAGGRSFRFNRGVIGGFFRELVDVENGFWPTFVGLRRAEEKLRQLDRAACLGRREIAEVGGCRQP